MKIDWNKAICHQKIDGSLIKIFYFKGKWFISTRGTAFAEAPVNGFTMTFKDLVLKALEVSDEDFQFNCNKYLNSDITYICEVTSVENRIVRSYTGYTLYYLCARNNKTYNYLNCTEEALALGMKIPEQFSFDSITACEKVVNELKNLDEGYVLYQDGVPVCKIKSPAYCAVHLLRGEGLNPKRICELVLTGEQEEYLAYFPEDRQFIQEYVNKFDDLVHELELAYLSCRKIPEQKEFALAIRNVQGNSVLFMARKMNISVKEAFKLMPDTAKLKMLMGAN